MVFMIIPKVKVFEKFGDDAKENERRLNSFLEKIALKAAKNISVNVCQTTSFPERYWLGKESEPVAVNNYDVFVNYNISDHHII